MTIHYTADAGGLWYFCPEMSWDFSPSDELWGRLRTREIRHDFRRDIETSIWLGRLAVSNDFKDFVDGARPREEVAFTTRGINAMIGGPIE